MFHTGDIIVVTGDSSVNSNVTGRLGRFISYYPTVLKEEEISNLHAVIVELPRPTENGIIMDRIKLMPDQITKISDDMGLLQWPCNAISEQPRSTPSDSR